MGGGSSRPSPPVKPPPIRVEAPFPVVDPIGIGKGMAQGCQQPTGTVCQLAVAAGTSASGAKLYRELGSISREKCKQYSVDVELVSKQKKSFDEFKTGLLAGSYYKDLGNQYCAQILFDPSDLAKITDPAQIPLDKARTPSIRPMSSSGSYSSVTKAFIKPSIPFEVEFNGKSYAIPVLTLMHPSPIRVENVQHDAMLTLGDPSPGNNSGVVLLVPLVGSLTAGASGNFIAKIARYLSGVLQPNPATGQYESIDIPTGSDWNLSSIFPGTPAEGGKTYVTKTGYYVWRGQPPLSLQWTHTLPMGGNASDYEYYSWQATDRTNLRYIMLSQPVQVNSIDLQTIRMLPTTPTTEALSPMEKTTLTYRAAGRMAADGSWVSECPASTTSLTNLFGGSREGLENQHCDPFGPGAFPSKAPGKDELVMIISGVLGAVGVFLAIYFAVVLFTKYKPGWWLADKGEMAGAAAAQFSIADVRKLLPTANFFKPSAKDEAEEKAAQAKKAAELEGKAADEAEARLSAPAVTPVPAEEKAEIAKMYRKTRAEDTDTAKAVEASLEEAKAQVKRDEATTAEDAKRKADEEAHATAEELKRAAEEELLRRNGPAGTGLDLTDAQLAQNADVERARLEAESAQLAPQGRPGRRTRTRLTPTAGPSAIDQALAKKEARDAAVKKQAESTMALFKEAEDRKAQREKEAADAVEAQIKTEKDKLEAEAEEARIKAASEAAAASASDVASKTLKRRTVQSSDRDLTKLEAERKRQAEELAQKDKEAERSTKPGAEGRASADVPTPKGERPPGLPVASTTTVSTTGAPRKVEDPTNALGDYETAVKAYEDSTPATREDTLKRIRGLEPRVRGISRNSPTLKSRYETLLQRSERATAAFKKEEDTVAKTRDSMFEKLAERESAVKKAVAEVNTTQMSNPTSIALDRLEKKVQSQIERLDAVLDQVEKGLKDIPAEDRPLLKLRLNQLKTYSTKQREASNKNMVELKKADFKGYKLDKGGRRKRLKRKSTRRYVA